MTVIDRVGTVTPGRPGARQRRRRSGFPAAAELVADAPRAAAMGWRRPRRWRSIRCWRCNRWTSRRNATAPPRRHGQALLTALGRLQRLLLEDGDQTAALEQIRALAEAMPVAADPGLAAAVDMVVLRARIESGAAGRVTQDG